MATIRRIFVATNCGAISELCEIRRIVAGVTQQRQPEKGLPRGTLGIAENDPHLRERKQGRWRYHRRTTRLER